MDTSTEVVNSPQENSVEDASTNDLRNFLAAQTESQVPEQEPENLETQPQETNPPVEMEETIVPPDEPVTEEERLAKRRIRPKSNEDQQVIDLYRSEGFQGTFQDAARVIYGEPVPSTQSSVPEEAPRDFVKETDEYIGGIRGEIEELSTKVVEASENLDTVQALELQREIMKKELEIQKAETRAEIQMDRRQAEFANTQRQKSTESREVAVQEYPELADKNTLYRKEFDNFVANASKDPDYQPIFQSPRWPELMAREFGTLKGQAPLMQRQVVQQASQQISPQVGNQAKMLTSGNTAQPANANKPVSDISQLSNEQLYSFLGQDDGRRPLR